MKSVRRNTFTGSFPSRSASTSGRHQGRVTKQDVRLAGLRRWDGRARVTTDWINVFQDPELCFSTGDVLVYLREPGQSSRGPAFRVHKAQLIAKGFDAILSKCIDRTPLPGATKCLSTTCPGCKNHPPPSELYMPAPSRCDLDTLFDHHITTRNFFAWLYNLPLAGKALGKSVVALKDRIDFYRPDSHAKTRVEVVSFVESQRYLDFRECVDHALAALTLAESLEIKDLWVDAFSHCVGLNHRGIQNSAEYASISADTRLLLEQARLEMEIRIARADRCLETFFEQELSSNSLAFSQAAKDHFERFRSWLHSFFIEQHGFWPPVGFLDDVERRSIYKTMYLDFRNLYHHLVDTKSSTSMIAPDLSGSGGVCTLQNIQSFDRRHKYEALPQPLPLLPQEPGQTLPIFGLQRRKSWNPVTKRRIDRDNRNALRIQSLIKSSNRDWSIMSNLLVRRYSEFEARTILDDTETLPMVEGRKVRWVLIYAILQTLISVVQAPSEVRNTDGLSYSLCCRIPPKLPWEHDEKTSHIEEERQGRSRVEPDVDHLQTHSHNNSPENSNNSSTADLLTFRLAKSLSKKEKKERRQTLPAQVNTAFSRSTSAPASRSTSLRRFMSRRNNDVPETPTLPKPTPFCEILIQGYGNGLNEVDNVPTISPSIKTEQHNHSQSSIADQDETPKASRPMSPSESIDLAKAKVNASINTEAELKDKSEEEISDLVQSSSPSVSRESSNASTNSTWSKSSISTNSDEAKANDSRPVSRSSSSTTIPLPARSKARPSVRVDVPSPPPLPPSLLVTGEDHKNHARITSKEFNKILDEQGMSQTAHITTRTWDEFLAMD